MSIIVLRYGMLSGRILLRNYFSYESKETHNSELLNIYDTDYSPVAHCCQVSNTHQYVFKTDVSLKC